MVAKLLPLIPAHQTYVEPFAGGASLFFAKEPSPVEVLNDLHSDIVNLYRCLREPEKAAEIQRLMELTPYSREEFYRFRDEYKTEADEVKRAYLWLYCIRCVFSGRETSKSWGYDIKTSYRGMASQVSKYQTSVAALPRHHARLRCAQIEHDDAIAVIKRYDTPETFFYCDPPYPAHTRSSSKYRHECDDSFHMALVDTLLAVKGKVLLSCYMSPLYQRFTDAGWLRKDWQTASSAAGRTKGSGLQGEGSAMARVPRIETVLANYSLPETIHLFPPNV